MSTVGTGLRHVALGDLEQEMATTRRVLERVPGDRLEWRPHPRSWALGELATHLTNIPHWNVATVTLDGMDLAGTPPRATPLGSTEELLAAFDRNVAELSEALNAADDDTLRRGWTLRHGERVILSRPRVALLRTVGISHIVHHRAQLALYLRLLDVPVPGIYGPSADEQAGF